MSQLKSVSMQLKKIEPQLLKLMLSHKPAALAYWTQVGAKNGLPPVLVLCNILIVIAVMITVVTVTIIIVIISIVIIVDIDVVVVDVVVIIGLVFSWPPLTGTAMLMDHLKQRMI